MEKARLINKNNGIVAPTANMKMTLQVTIVFVNKSIRYFSCNSGTFIFCMNMMSENTVWEAYIPGIIGSNAGM